MQRGKKCLKGNQFQVVAGENSLVSDWAGSWRNLESTSTGCAWAADSLRALAATRREVTTAKQKIMAAGKMRPKNGALQNVWYLKRHHNCPGKLPSFRNQHCGQQTQFNIV